jgi:hypothetical protein
MNMNGPWYEDSMWQDWDFPWFAVDAHGHVALFWTNLTDWAPFELTEMNPDDGILEELLERPRTSRALLLRPAGSGTWGEPARGGGARHLRLRGRARRRLRARGRAGDPRQRRGVGALVRQAVAAMSLPDRELAPDERGVPVARRATRVSGHEGLSPA